MKNIILFAILVLGAGFAPVALAAEYSVSTNKNVYAVSEPIEINWTAPEDEVGTNDWITISPVNSSDRTYRDWEYIGTLNSSGSMTLTESVPGEYEVRILQNGTYILAAKSSPITITRDDASDNDDSDDDTDGGSGGDDGSSDTEDYLLEITSTNVNVGDTVTVEWETPSSEFNRSDWIGLFLVGESNRAYKEWFYVPSETGSRSIRVSQAGEYEFRYLPKGSYTTAIESESFTATRDSDGNNDSDDDTDGGSDDGGSGGDDGSSDTEDYLLEITSTNVNVGDTVTVEWETPSSEFNRSDWIGLFLVGESNRAYKEWFYVPSETGSRSIRVSQAGEYEFRYLPKGSYTTAIESESFTATRDSDGNDDSDDDTDGGSGNIYSVQADQTEYMIGEIANAEWDTPSGGFIFGWVGLYRPGTSNRAYLDWEYTDILSKREQFPLRQVGTFEFRYFRGNSFELLATSETFTVTDETTTNICNAYNLDVISNFPPPNGPIIALGDSITFGIGATPGEDYVSELEDRLNVNIINSGVPGDTTQDVLARLNTDVISEDPGTVIVFIGGNDEIRRLYESLNDSAADRELEDELDAYVRGRLGLEWQDIPLISRAQTFQNIRTMIEEIQSTGATTILVGFDNTIFNNTIETAYRDIAEDTGSFYVEDIYDDIFGRPSRMSDLIHPNDLGYDIVADRIQPALECTI